MNRIRRAAESRVTFGEGRYGWRWHSGGRVRQSVRRVLRKVPAETVVVLDEAYLEFLSTPHRLDAGTILDGDPNTVV